MSFLLKEPIILASSSPRRRGILDLVHIHYEVIKPILSEDRPFQIPPLKMPEFLAQAKAREVSQRTQTRKIILAADTLVYMDDSVIGKPKDRKEACEMLRRFSGSTHSVITGVTICCQDKQEHFTEQTRVQFYKLSDEEIAYYVDEYKPYDKAGAYSIHEWMGLYGIKAIEGDYYNVLGLPVGETVRRLIAFSREML